MKVYQTLEKIKGIELIGHKTEPNFGLNYFYFRIKDARTLTLLAEALSKSSAYSSQIYAIYAEKIGVHYSFMVSPWDEKAILAELEKLVINIT